MSFDDYDRLVESFEGFTLSVPVHWPQPEEFDLFEADPDKWIPYLVWIHEKCTPRTNGEKYSHKNINSFLCAHLELVDGEDDVP